MMKKLKRKIKFSNSFIMVLAIVSIIGFIGIISKSLFDINMESFVEAGLMFTVGIGLLIEADVNSLKKLKTQGLTPENFNHLTTFTIGALALIAGFFSFPIIRIETPGFIAIKGIISIIAVIVIVLQTWVIE